jgi:thiol:disulfide interchange protein DsbD
MKRILLPALVLAVMLSGAALAALKGSGDVVKATAKTPAIAAAAGEKVDFAVMLDIETKWHIYAHGDTNFIGVDLVPAEDFPLEEFQAVYPEGHKKEFFGEMVAMIEGKEVIAATAVVPAGMPKGEHALAMKVTVQACDDKTCLAPAYLPVEVKLTVK